MSCCRMLSAIVPPHFLLSSMHFLVTSDAQRHKVFRLVAAAIANKFYMMDIQLPIIYWDCHAILVLIGMELSALLASKIISVQNSKGIWVSPPVPNSYLRKRSAVFVATKTRSATAQRNATPFAMFRGNEVWTLKPNSITVHLLCLVHRRKRSSCAISLPRFLVCTHGISST